MKKKHPASVKLKTVKPSGEKENSFFELVYQIVREIPPGRVTSYGAIAKALGAGSSARMVGWALNGSHHVSPPVPAHRVVNRNGMLSGKMHFNPPERMEALLRREGVEVKDDKVVNFAKIFWDPAGL
jgi:methylated-DNA-protein-cysteine methyltransferase-like protein